MNRNKLTIDLRRVALTDKQMQDLHNAIHNTVAKHLEKAAKANAQPAKKTAKPGKKAAAPVTKTANPKKQGATLESFTEAAPVAGAATPSVAAAPAAVGAAPGTKTANIKVTFSSTIPGKSGLTAIHNGVSKNLNQTGSLPITGVASGDIIIIQGQSLGTTTVTIDIGADPTQMNFGPGHFNDNFFIN